MDHNILFRIFDTLRNQYVLSGAFLLPASVLERMCSNTYVYDYESTPRIHISLSIIAAQNVLAFVMAFTMIFMGRRNRRAVSLSNHDCFRSSTFDSYLHNRRRRQCSCQHRKSKNRMTGSSTLRIQGYWRCHQVTMLQYRGTLEHIDKANKRSYSLSARFQVIENIRVEKVLMKHDACSLTLWYV